MKKFVIDEYLVPLLKFRLNTRLADRRVFLLIRTSKQLYVYKV